MSAKATLPKGFCKWIRKWLQKNPGRALEDEMLKKFHHRTHLSQAEARSLCEWKFQSDARRRKAAVEGIDDAHWSGPNGAETKIKEALRDKDDFKALRATAALSTAGVLGWGPAMGSAILAATQPDRFTVIDKRALKSLRAHGLHPVGDENATLADWTGYLATCRSIALQCGFTLRDVDRALYAANGSVGMPPP